MWKCCLPKNDNATEDIRKPNVPLRFEEGEGKEAVINSNLQHKFYVDFKELIEGYENNKGEYIDMSQPRDATYATETRKYNIDTQEIEIVVKRLGKEVDLTSAAKIQDGIKNELFDPFGYRSMTTEVRGITIRQLRAILPLIKRRCKKEQWTRSVFTEITLENATMYDVNEYIIKPFTEFSQKSFVETLPSTKGTQPPRWFVSHFWGETFVHTMACLECLVHQNSQGRMRHQGRGGGLTEDTPLWICSFANNQQILKSEIPTNPTTSAFTKAMKTANYRIMSILDENNQVFTRLWCMYELYLALLLSREQGIIGVLAFYTYYKDSVRFLGKRTAVVGRNRIIDGLDYDMREKHFFPRNRLLNFLTVSIQNAEASEEEDHRHILNSLVGREGADLDLETLKHHENYDKLHDAIRGAVFSHAFPNATLSIEQEQALKEAVSKFEAIKDF